MVVQVHGLSQGWPTSPASAAALWEGKIVKNHVLFMKSSHQVFLSASVFQCRLAMQNRKYEDENRGFKTEWKEEFVCVEGNQPKYFVLKT
jgi:hypothetical protein